MFKFIKKTIKNFIINEIKKEVKKSDLYLKGIILNLRSSPLFRIKNSIFCLPDFEIEHIQNIIVKTGDYYEIKLLEKFRISLLQYGKGNLGVFVDIGANLGNHTLFILNELGFDKSIAIEPSLKTFELLSRNIKLNDLESKVRLHNIALGNIYGKMFLKHVESLNHGMNTLIYEHTSENEKSVGEFVNVSTLDEIIKDEKVNVIKIDVEGFELEVLKGGIQTLRKNKPILWIEILDKKLFDSCINLIPFKHQFILLNEYNYLIIPLDKMS